MGERLKYIPESEKEDWIPEDRATRSCDKGDHFLRSTFCKAVERIEQHHLNIDVSSLELPPNQPRVKPGKHHR